MLNDTDVKIGLDILNAHLFLWNHPIKEKIAIEKAIQVMQLYLSVAGKMPEEKFVPKSYSVLLRTLDSSDAYDKGYDRGRSIGANEMRQDCILNFMKMLPSEKEGIK